MRGKRLFVLTAMSVFLIFLLQGSLFAASKPVVLKFATYLPPVHGTSKAIEAFAADLEARTNGEVTIKYFPGGSLAKAPGMIKAIEAGITISVCPMFPIRPDGSPSRRYVNCPSGIPRAGLPISS